MPMNDVRFESRCFATVNADAARARGLQAGNGIAQRAFAHAVAANDGQHAAAELDGHTLNSVAFAVIDVKAGELECGAAAAPFSHGHLRDKSAVPPCRPRCP